MIRQTEAAETRCPMRAALIFDALAPTSGSQAGSDQRRDCDRPRAALRNLLVMDAAEDLDDPRVPLGIILTSCTEIWRDAAAFAKTTHGGSAFAGPVGPRTGGDGRLSLNEMHDQHSR